MLGGCGAIDLLVDDISAEDIRAEDIVVTDTIAATEVAVVTVDAATVTANQVEAEVVDAETVTAETVETVGLIVTGPGPTVIHGPLVVDGTLTVTGDGDFGGEVEENVPILPVVTPPPEVVPPVQPVFSSLALLLDSPINNGCYLIGQNFTIAGKLFGKEGPHHLMCLVADSPTQLIELDVMIDSTGVVEFEQTVEVGIESQASQISCLASGEVSLYEGNSAHSQDFDFATIDIRQTCPNPP
ncbi:MAG: hypothetical protein AAB415_01225 [Patescibacteria group bacterium]